MPFIHRQLKTKKCLPGDIETAQKAKPWSIKRIAFVMGMIFFCATACAEIHYQSQAECKASLLNDVGYGDFTLPMVNSFGEKSDTTLDRIYRSYLPAAVRSNAVMVSAIPSKDNSMLALLYAVCCSSCNSEDEYTTYLLAVEKKSWIGKKIAEFKTDIGANYSALSVGAGWIASTHNFVMERFQFNPGLGYSCVGDVKTVYDMNTAKQISQIKLNTGSRYYYDEFRKIVDPPNGCGVSDEMAVVDLLTGKKTVLKNGEYVRVEKVEQENGQWAVLFHKDDSILKLDLP